MSTPSRSASPFTFESLAAGAAVALLTVAVYLPTAGARFVNLDDPQYVTESEFVRNPTLAGLGRVFRELKQPTAVAGYYQPLTIASLMFDRLVFGSADEPFGFHISNIMLHGVSAALVFLAARGLAGGLLVPLAAASLFAVHPVQVEAVAWVAQRKTVLSGALALGSLTAYLQATASGVRAWRWGAVLLYLLALLAKPTVLPLPVLFVLLDYWPLRRLTWRSVAEKWPMWLLMPAAAYVTWRSQQSAGSLAVPATLGGGVALGLIQLSAYNLGLYVRHMAWPTGLTLIYPLPTGLGSAGGSHWLPLLAVLLAGGAIVALRRKAPGLFVAALGFVVLLAPTLGPVRYMQSCVGDRFCYLPIAFLAVLGAAWAGGLQRQQAGRVAAVAALAAAGVLAGQTVRQQSVWLDDEHLWTRVLEFVPDDVDASYNLAGVRLGQGDAAAAQRLAETAVRGRPDFGAAHLVRSKALLEQGLTPEALEAAHRAIALGLGRYEWQARLVVGLGRLRGGDLRSAQVEFRRVVAAQPNDAATRAIIGNSLLVAGYADVSVDHLRAAAQLSPGAAGIRQNLATALTLTRRLPEARSEYLVALSLRNEAGDAAPDARLALAKVLVDLGSLVEAEAQLKMLPPEPPFAAESDFNLASIRAMQERPDEALFLLDKALRADPSLIKRASLKPQLATLHDDPRWKAMVTPTTAPDDEESAAPEPPP